MRGVNSTGEGDKWDRTAAGVLIKGTQEVRGKVFEESQGNPMGGNISEKCVRSRVDWVEPAERRTKAETRKEASNQLF